MNGRDGNASSKRCKAHKWIASVTQEEGVRTFQERICWLCGKRKVLTFMPDDTGELKLVRHTLIAAIETAEWVLEYHDPDALELHPTTHRTHIE